MIDKPAWIIHTMQFANRTWRHQNLHAQGLVCQLLPPFCEAAFENKNTSLGSAALHLLKTPIGKDPWRASAHRKINYPNSTTTALLFHQLQKGNLRLTLTHTFQKPPLCVLLVWMTGSPWRPWDSQTSSTCPTVFRPQRPSPAPQLPFSSS